MGAVPHSKAATVSVDGAVVVAIVEGVSTIALVMVATVVVVTTVVVAVLVVVRDVVEVVTIVGVVVGVISAVAFCAVVVATRVVGATFVVVQASAGRCEGPSYRHTEVKAIANGCMRIQAPVQQTRMHIGNMISQC